MRLIIEMYKTPIVLFYLGSLYACGIVETLAIKRYISGG